MRLALALEVLADEMIYLLVVVKLIGADIHQHRAGVGDDIVLGSGVHYGERHLGRSQELAHFLKLVIPDPSHVVECLVDGVHALVSGGMTALAMGDHVQYHQSLLCHGWLHARRLTHNRYINMRQERKGTADAILARHFLLGRGEVDEIVGLRLRGEQAEHLEQGAQATAAVVAAQAIEDFFLLLGFPLLYLYPRMEGISLPRIHGLHGVDMGVEQ